MTEPLWRIETCEFKREEHSEYEIGLLLNEGALGILDRFGQLVPRVWTWKRLSYFVIDIEAIFKMATAIRCDI